MEKIPTKITPANLEILGFVSSKELHNVSWVPNLDHVFICALFDDLSMLYIPPSTNFKGNFYLCVGSENKATNSLSVFSLDITNYEQLYYFMNSFSSSLFETGKALGESGVFN